MKFFLTKRKKLDALRNRYDELLAQVGCPSLPTYFVNVSEREINFSDQEVCFFVTYCAKNVIKPHVIHHVKCLVKMGLHVILIVNSDTPSEFNLKKHSLMPSLSACFLRQNIGLNFGAWSDVFRFYRNQSSSWKRLYLVNDSIIGPLDKSDFQRMIEKIRNTDADFQGLTSNIDHRFHLQSFFLVLENSLLNSRDFRNYFENIHQFRDKQFVIDVYETWLTQYVQSLGFRLQAHFELKRICKMKNNDTIYRWRELLDVGFCYVKSSVIQDGRNWRDERLAAIRDSEHLWGL